MQSKRIKNILLIFIFVIIFLFSNISYASGESQGSSVFGNLLISIFDIITSIWYILPIIAGKLLTNDLLYGTALHLDALLWHIWNFSRSLANFLIGFLFIYFIFKFIVSGKDDSLIKTNLPKIAFGSIIINASWFILAALIDISTILIAGFGSLPLKFHDISKNTKIAVPTNITFDSTKCDTTKSNCFNGSASVNVTGDNKLTLDKLQSYETYISGPLFFMGANILGITTSKGKLLDEAYDVNKEEFRHNGTAVKALIQIILILLFTIPIIILIVVNIVRIFWVWIYICFSPLIFLDQIFGGKVASKQKAFGFKNMVGLIFQPALVVLAFSTSFIFIITLYSTLIKGGKTIGEADAGKVDYTDNVKKVFHLDDSANGIVKIEGFGKIQDSKGKTEYIGGFFSYLIVSIILIIFLWTLIKLSFKATEVTSGISDSMFKFSEDLAKTAKFIPTPYGAQSIGSIQKLGSNISQIPTGIYGKQATELAKKFGTVNDVTAKKTTSIVNDMGGSSSSKKRQGLKAAIKELTPFRTKGTIDENPNAKKIIDDIGTHIIAKLPPQMIGIKDKFNKATTYEQKLEVILKNETTIEGAL